MHNDNTLRRALTANAVFSGTTGLISLALAGRLAVSLGPPDWALRALGVGLVIFAGLVAIEARGPKRSGARQIIAADVAWVAAAAGIIAFTPGWLTATGQIVLGVVSALVAALAIAQWRGLRAAT